MSQGHVLIGKKLEHGIGSKALKITGEFSLKPCTWENFTENEWGEVEKKGKKEDKK